MTTIKKSWLRAQGIDLPDEDLVLLAEKCESALELRVGTVLAELLTDDQLDEFEVLIDEGVSEAKRLEWLTDHVPDYKNAVHRETDMLKQAIINSKDPATYIKNLDT